ncbi:MAG: EAL domain-containing protein [Lachnospiraceae bacterium]|nr:EAL domain-containing protein [Lachnospiraceae bacterium]
MLKRDKKEKKGIREDSSVKSILVTALVMLLFSMGLSLAMSISMESAYRKEISEDFQEHHILFASILGRYYSREAETARNMAGVLSTFTSMYSIDDVLEVEGRFTTVDEQAHIGYVGGDGFIYLDGERYYPEVHENLFEYFKGYKIAEGKTMVTEAGDLISCIDSSDVVAIAPVHIKGECVGFIFVPIDTERIFVRETFASQTEEAELLLVNKQRKIIATSSGKADNAENKPVTVSGDEGVEVPASEETAIGITIQELLDEEADGKIRTRQTIQNLTRGISNDEEGMITLRDSDGYKFQVSYAPVLDSYRLYLVTRYNSNIIESGVQPMIYRSVSTCLTIICIMIGAIMYVWLIARRTSDTAERLAYEDPLTGGKNVNYFNEFAQILLHDNKEMPYVICRFDIANFRYINESYGHVKADQVLKACVKEFEGCFGSRELCVRMNADQFLALMVNDAGLDGRLEAFRAAVNAAARGVGIKYPIKFKLGVYQVRKHEKDVDVMIDRANAARRMLRGDEKNNRLTYSEEIASNMHKANLIESQMQHALASGEFKVYLQAKWDIEKNTVCGCEALVRWVRSDGKIVRPDEFIPLFEKNGFIEMLDFYMLETVCQMVCNLQKEGKMVYPVSVNQSRVLLHNPDYLDNVVDILRKYKIPDGLVELEITETVFEDEKDRIFSVLDKLRACGVKLNMDDFGSGYSSLNMLKDVPFDVIKIDRIFFSASVDNEKSRKVLRKIVEMINDIGMEVVCEGVENQEHVEFLRGIGVRKVQGFYYAKPVPAEEFINNYCE